MNRKILLVGAVTLVLFALTEIGLRLVFGFCSTVLFRADPDFEYIQIPQSTTRFRKHSFYNTLSQRNREMKVDSNTIIVLGFGDSVLNGGVITEQDSLATTLLTDALSAKLGRAVLVTNISAGSWGPDNCFAYLEKYGNFGAKLILLVVSSHDSYDTMDFKPVVDSHRAYPSCQYKLAVWELLDRYLIPKARKLLFPENKVADNSDNLLINKYKRGATFNPGFSQFVNYSDSTGIPLVVYLHADKKEKAANEYNPQGKKIIRYLEQNRIPLVRDLNYENSMDDYRDGIHLSEHGQRTLYLNTKDTLSVYLSKSIE